jgi:hypothetical protein
MPYFLWESNRWVAWEDHTAFGIYFNLFSVVSSDNLLWE